VSPQDLERLRKNPDYFIVIVDAYQHRLRQHFGALHRDFNDQAVAFSLATMVAYELASYRGFHDPEGRFPAPRGNSLPELLAVPKLACNEYCYLAARLYRIAFPAAIDPKTTIFMAGFGSGPFGNHAQLFFTSQRISLLGDPTLGLVARTTFPNLRQGNRLASSAILQPVYRFESTAYMQNALAAFRSNVYLALIGGSYPKASLIYWRNVTNLP